ncbi:hypothetical protein OP10G_4291 [Fimbriimonas ginsengisoli Gsoil 348]|uniref:Uncharacterized protein n=1 Tax=Fimbriimonas ginsengisoli Gsoil 348 TaxID=661478 RepID=A0A068NYZ0_FIMGI|nr:hypothetical protein OP10G_4291 [Fimbriimonas ginsengisoli Gsoil 348]
MLRDENRVSTLGRALVILTILLDVTLMWEPPTVGLEL